eukprot:CAMPEP_0181094748 /NCGR_PEP_ID=MMETSP1071-20121207/10156_1 /TAXON_ID=35127 /ORGANISM="Thalassiosira sp., Strain NH16" /LENGTH=267 /DNA_ID=CAMNT_0023177093 /DNA_START=87 /DNA_END=890 /DNA_ORIENTATION=-
MAASRVRGRGSAILLLLIVFISAQSNISSAFLLSPIADRVQCIHYSHLRESFTVRHAAADDSSSEESENSTEGGLGFTALPAIGASSFWDRPQDETNNVHVNASTNSDLARPGAGKDTKENSIIISEHTNLVSAKFKIQYTCKVCSTRNSHSVTRIAYRKGIVIAMCKSCHSKHLIADNLGWSNYIGGFDFDNGETDIEMYMKNRDQEARENGGKNVGAEKENDLVMRVNRDVFDLENVLYKGQEDNNASSEKIVAEDDHGDESSWN